ncbi:valine--tRNA ligase [Candidatus Saccharibacteria bacterium]|nr:valine--tRNA ligase [Candidatus Saccharibacteria bacterium]
MNLAKAYEPNHYEPTIYGLWESSGIFEPHGEGEPYSILMPPPNANGSLHIGHALTFNLQDILIRHHRMRGRKTVYIPGADHAGFETWVVYEKQLEKQGKSRFDFTRDQLYNRVWDFVEQQRGGMELQLRALGASAAWQHLTFTLDKKVIDTVYNTFEKMWNDKLIYRGERIVNYCTKHHTSFADIEVEHRNEKGKLWEIAYPLIDRVGDIIVATTRPETMLGDMAIAVHPDDARYKDLVGTKALIPVVNREIPIIADSAVDPKFGTGAVKVTPAHDPLDFEIGERHHLKPMQVIGFDGKMTEEAPQSFQGLTVEEARVRIIAALEAAEALRGEKTHEHSVGHCYKCGTVIQPLIKDQWFLKVKPLAERAKQAIQNDEIAFTPASSKRVLLQYLDNLKDWNLSRQIPWGIPIPAFQNVHDSDDWIFNTNLSQEHIEIDGKRYRREEDTFDTWFSSGQWPFIATDYLEGGDLSSFYPTNMMETGHDLLDRWVARMIMLSLYMTEKVPFKEVYMHGMVLDEHGKKMSKSKGNVINPQEVIEEYGSDALRLGIVSSRSAGQNQAFSRAKVIAGRNFCNKLWNIARYIEGKIDLQNTPREPSAQSMADHWIINKLNQANGAIVNLLENHRFAEAAEVVYHTIWDSVADWYIEASKYQENPKMLLWVLETSLKLAHPFAPFVTETVWQILAWEKTPLIASQWPKAVSCDKQKAEEFTKLQQIISEARNISAHLQAGPQVLIFNNSPLISENISTIQHLAKLQAVKQVDAPSGLRLNVPYVNAYLDVDDQIVQKYRDTVERKLSELRTKMHTLTLRIENEDYVKNAPPAIVEETRNQLKEYTLLEAQLAQELKNL